MILRGDGGLRVKDEVEEAVRVFLDDFGLRASRFGPGNRLPLVRLVNDLWLFSYFRS